MIDLSNNSRFAFVVCERPVYSLDIQNPERKWQEFLTNIQYQLKPVEGIQRIHDNVWLIPLANGMPFLTKLFEWATSMGIPLRILFLESEPAWIKYPPDPETSPS
jgi:hypothetical protein